MAAGTLKAGAYDVLRGVGERSGESESLVPPQGAEIDSGKRGVAKRAPPRMVERVDVGARGQHQDGWAAAHRRGELGRMGESRRVGPVQVFEHEHQGRP